MHTTSGTHLAKANHHAAMSALHAKEALLAMHSLKLMPKRNADRHCRQFIGHHQQEMRARRKMQRARAIEIEQERAEARRNPELALT